MNDRDSRRLFLQTAGLASLGALSAGRFSLAAEPTKSGAGILGEAGEKSAERPKEVWKPVSDRKIRVGIVGYGVCKFGAEFGFQDHPNVVVAAVSDLIPERRQELAKVCRCEKTYPSLEELVKDDSLRRSLWRPTPLVTPGIASMFSITASMSPAPCRPCSDRWKTRICYGRRSNRADEST